MKENIVPQTNMLQKETSLAASIKPFNIDKEANKEDEDEEKEEALGLKPISKDEYMFVFNL